MRRFGRENVFLDIDAIPPGADWRKSIETTVAACDVILPLIGHNWLTVSDESGRRRLDNPDDVLRFEIELALKEQIHIIPIQLHGTPMPGPDELPESLVGLVGRQSVRIDAARWRSDVQKLIRELQRIQREKTSVVRDRGDHEDRELGQTQGAARLEEEPWPDTPLVWRMAHDGGFWVSDFSPDRRSFVSGSFEGTARVWETTSGRELARVTHDEVCAVAFSPDGRCVASGGGREDGTARVWEATSGRQLAHVTHDDEVGAVAFSPDGRYVVSGGGDKTARVWEATSGRELARVDHGPSVGPLLDHLVRGVAFSPDGRYVVSGGDDGTARVWEATSGQERARMTHDGYVWAVAFSPDGRYVVSGGNEGTARVWEATSGQELARVTHDGEDGRRESVRAVAFSPDGRYVVSGGLDCNARVWEATSGQELARMAHDGEDGTSGSVRAVAFSPDGRYVVSGGDEGTARVWEATSGQELARMIHAHDGDHDSPRAVAFSPEGRYVVSVGHETVCVFAVPSIRADIGG